jgi:hypothetical protein
MQNLILSLLLIVVKIFTLAAKPIPLADLSISGLTFNDYGADPTNFLNDIADFKAAICYNTATVGGTGVPYSSSIIRLTGYFSNDNKHTTGDGDILIGNIDLQLFTGKTTIKVNEINNGTAKFIGKHLDRKSFFVLIIDETNIVQESNETNNQSFIEIPAMLNPEIPDLIVNDVSGVKFEYVQGMNNVVCKYSIQNIGSYNSYKSCIVQAFWSKDDQKSTDDMPVISGTVGPIASGGFTTGKLVVFNLMPIQQTSLNCCTTLTQTLAYFPYIIIVVNPNMTIEEQTKDNRFVNPYKNNAFVVKHNL